MIVRPGNPPLLITQPDHAALAGRIMDQWRAGGLPTSPRREDIRLAIREHDGGWTDLDREPIIGPDGAVLDFTGIAVRLRQGVWPRGVAALSRAPYAAALVAHHAVHVYRRYRGDAAWTAFFAQMESLRDEHLRASGVAPDVMLQDYVFLRMGDLISLTFCNAWTAEQKDDTGSGYACRLEGDRVIVTPDPFAGAEIAIAVQARDLSGNGSALRGVVAGMP